MNEENRRGQEDGEAGGTAEARPAEESEGFMNPRCAGLDRLWRISVFEEDGGHGKGRRLPRK